MENRGEARERSSQGGSLSSSQDGIMKETSSVDISVVSPGDGTKATEKKVHHPQSRSSIMPAPHRSLALDRHGQPSSTGGALDLQSLVGRSGSSSSSIGGITVPIRLDALSYLLNNAVLGAQKVPSQMPSYPSMYPAYPYAQMGYPYGTYMNSPPYNMPPMNQYPAYQPGVISCDTQHGAQAFQYPMPNFNQFMGGTAPSQNQAFFSSVQPQGGIPVSSGVLCTTPSVQDNRGTFQSNSNTLPQKSNDGFGNNKSNPFTSGTEKPSSPPQRGFGRFGDKQSEDSWSGRPQNSYNRGGGRGRGDFGGRSWQGNSSGQERRFGDRSWNMDSGGRRRFQESPDSGQDRGNSFKRGRWQDSKGKDGENRDSWQQRNRQGFSPPWSKAATFQNRFKSNEEEKVIAKTDQSDAKDDWEMDYAEDPPASKTSEQSSNSSLLPPAKICDSPQTRKPSDNSLSHNEDVRVKGFSPNLVDEKEEEELDSCSDKGNLKTMETKPEVKDKDPALEATDSPAEKPLEVGEEGKVEDVCSCIISVESEDN